MRKNTITKDNQEAQLHNKTGYDQQKRKLWGY